MILQRGVLHKGSATVRAEIRFLAGMLSKDKQGKKQNFSVVFTIAITFIILSF